MPRRELMSSAHAIFGEAARIHATCRALGRGLQAFSRDGAAHGRGRRAALAGWVVADVLVWQAIRKRAIPLAARLGVDLVDVAFWAGASRSGLVSSLGSQVAVELEAGLSWGAPALAVPVVEAVASTVARRVSGGRAEVDVHVPHLGAVLVGIVIRGRESSRLDRAREEHAAQLSAKTLRAFLGGQNDVAMGASSVVDLLAPLALLLGAPNPHSALSAVLSGWKASVAERTREHVVYLDQALRLWQDEHNDHPDLSGYAVVSVDEGHGTTLLTSYQSGELAARLEARALRGGVRVSVAARGHGEDRRPGRALRLVVDGEPLDLPPDPASTIAELNTTPPMMLFSAWASLMPLRQRDGGLPLAAALGPSVAWLAAAWRFVGRPPRDALRETLVTAISLATVQGWVGARYARVRRTPAGANLFHGTFGIAPVALLLATSWSWMPVAERRAAVAALVALAAGSYAVADRPRSIVDLACALAWPAAALVGGNGVARASVRQASLLVEELSAADDAAEARAFEDGRQLVVELVRAAVADAEQLFAERQTLEPALRAAARERLDEIRRLLGEL
jgi:hypothetical protein